MKKRFINILLITIGAAFLAIIIFFFINNIVIPIYLQSFAENNLPKFVQADWIDLSRIGTISKFRSGVGHDFSDHNNPNGEHCRSMKHYFSPDGAGGKDAKQESLENLGDPQKKASLSGSKEPVPPTEPTIDIYSPVDGKISKIEQPGEGNTPIGGEVQIRPGSHPEYQFRLGHVYPKGIYEGQQIKAGHKIGVIGAHQSVDMVLGISAIGDYRLVSYFQVMPDIIFEKYKERFGVKDRSEFIISRKYRDAHPLKCVPGSEEFVGGSSSDPDNIITLSK